MGRLEGVQVLPQGGLPEEHGLLRDVRQRLAQRVQAHLAEVLAVDQHRAALDLGHPQQRDDDRGLAAARAAHDAELLPGGDAEGEAPERGLQLFPVAHRHGPVLDGPPRGPRASRGLHERLVLRQPLLRLLRQGAVLQDALGRRELLLDVGDALGEGLDVAGQLEAVCQHDADKRGVRSADRQDRDQRKDRGDDAAHALEAQSEPAGDPELEQVARLVVVELQEE
mmetsp:Transcript_27760/g.73347  ORF Transcript_27760/g.73347 Transcript_27760/m.73347 type:complete len:225 (-) Transcript_27760:1563-2237(-)